MKKITCWMTFQRFVSIYVSRRGPFRSCLFSFHSGRFLLLQGSLGKMKILSPKMSQNRRMQKRCNQLLIISILDLKKLPNSKRKSCSSSLNNRRTLNRSSSIQAEPILWFLLKLRIRGKNLSNWSREVKIWSITSIMNLTTTNSPRSRTGSIKPS